MHENSRIIKYGGWALTRRWALTREITVTTHLAIVPLAISSSDGRLRSAAATPMCSDCRTDISTGLGEGGREGGKEGRREGRKEGGREVGREGGWEGGREGGRVERALKGLGIVLSVCQNDGRSLQIHTLHDMYCTCTCTCTNT